MYSSQSVTEQFGVCAPDRQTTFTRAGHNASWSTFLDGRQEVPALHTRALALLLQRHRRLEKRSRSLEQALHKQHHRRCARFGDRARARRNRRLTSFSNRRRSCSSRIALERRSSRGGCTTGSTTGCVSTSGVPSSGTAPPCSTSSCAAGFSLAGSSPACSGRRSTSFTRRLCDCCAHRIGSTFHSCRPHRLCFLTKNWKPRCFEFLRSR